MYCWYSQLSSLIVLYKRFGTNLECILTIYPGEGCATGPQGSVLSIILVLSSMYGMVLVLALLNCLIPFRNSLQEWCHGKDTVLPVYLAQMLLPCRIECSLSSMFPFCTLALHVLPSPYHVVFVNSRGHGVSPLIKRPP